MPIMDVILHDFVRYFGNIHNSYMTCRLYRLLTPNTRMLFVFCAVTAVAGHMSGHVSCKVHSAAVIMRLFCLKLSNIGEHFYKAVFIIFITHAE